MAKRFRIIVFILLAVTSIAHGQKEALVEFEFKVFGVGSDSYEGLFYYDGKEYLPLTFHRTHRSIKTYKYLGSKELLVYVENPNFRIADPELPEFLPIAQVTVKADAKRLLVVFSANRKNRTVLGTERKFNLFALNDERNYFSRNTIVILNTTGAELFGRVAGTNINLPNGASAPIPFDKTNKGKSLTKIALALETEDGARLVMSNDVRLSTNRRILLILEPPRRAGSYRIAVRKLSESIFPAEEDD